MSLINCEVDLGRLVVSHTHASNYLGDDLGRDVTLLVGLFDQGTSGMLAHYNSCIQISLSDLDLALEGSPSRRLCRRIRGGEMMHACLTCGLHCRLGYSYLGL